MTHLLRILTLTYFLIFVGFDDMALAQPAPTGTVQQPLSVKESKLWSNRRINVCWENPSAADANERRWVREAIGLTWARETAVGFTGWARCTGDDSGIRIRIRDEGPHTKGLGTSLDGKANGMVLNFTFNSWDSNCRNGGTQPSGFERSDRIRSSTEVEYCIKVIAVHEFGHVLGAAHEQNRSDAPRCSEPAQGTDGDWNVTRYDSESVMNYCSPVWAGAGNLSQLDIAGITQVYGTNSASIANTRSDIEAISTIPGGSSVYTVGSEGNIWSLFFDPTARAPAWTEGFRLSPTRVSATGSVTALSTVVGGTSLFTLRSDGSTLSAYFDPARGQWTKWFSLEGSKIVGRPESRARVAAISTVMGGTSLFVVGKDRAVWSKYYDPRSARPAWSRWFSLGGRVRGGSSVSTVSTVAGGVTLFVIGTDNAVWSKYFDPILNRWSGWFSLKGRLRDSGEITAVTTVPGGISLFGVGINNDLQTCYFDTKRRRWTNWFSLGGQVQKGSSVAAVSPFPGSTSLFVVGLDNAVWSRYYDPRVPNAKWSNWFSLGGTIGDSRKLVALSTISGGVSLFAKRVDGYSQSAFFDPRTRDPRWSGWFSLAR